VGGTGFYIDSVETPPASMTVPIDTQLREKLASFTVQQLQSYLKKQSKEALLSMNSSDSLNPRRLVRKIEICLYAKNHAPETTIKTDKHYDSLWVGLDAPLEVLEMRIEKRVAERLQKGFEVECQTLYDKGLLHETIRSSSATGYRQWLEYHSQKITRAEFIRKWILAEIQYARRQKTWFKKASKCHWFASGDEQTLSSVVQMIENW
jgi:tRNA dimethylallyltransferase